MIRSLGCIVLIAAALALSAYLVPFHQVALGGDLQGIVIRAEKERRLALMIAGAPGGLLLFVAVAAQLLEVRHVTPWRPGWGASLICFAISFSILAWFAFAA